MKVSASIRTVFEGREAICKLLKSRVDKMIVGLIPETWHFESRVKHGESFAQKLETGRFELSAIDDLFACTLVVPNMARISEAEAVISEHFAVVSRKPNDDELVNFRATEFAFDHTRLYVTLPPSMGLDSAPVNEVVFEVQIKTFLQHAWSIATHDLTYKTSEVSWGKERVAAQVKATLEAAEVSILEAERIDNPNNRLLHRRDTATSELLRTVSVLSDGFERSDLPSDMKRLGESIISLFRAGGLALESLEDLLASGRQRRNGSHPSNLSPYSVVVQYLFEVNIPAMRKALRSKQSRVLVVEEITLPADIDPAQYPHAVWIAR